MKKLAIVTAVALAGLAGTAVAGTQVAPNPNAKSQGSTVGLYSSQVKGNGASVSEEAKSGTRGSDVQAIQAGDNHGSQK